MKKFKLKAFFASLMVLLMLTGSVPASVFADLSAEPEKWYTGSELTIDKHIIFGEDKMYTDGKSNRGFNNLVDNNAGTVFYVTSGDSTVNYQNLSSNGKEISVTVHMSKSVVIDHFKIVAGADTFKANYAHRNPTGWNLKAGSSADSCNTVLIADEPIDASSGYKPNVYSFENTTAYQYYQFTITSLAGAGRSGHDSPFPNPSATCTLADIAFGGPIPPEHTDHDDIEFTKWSSTNSLPTTAGNYYLSSDVTISNTWNVPSGTTNLCLNGHGIKMTGNSSVMTVSAGATLKIYDCDTETEHRFSVSNKKSNGAGFATVNDSLTSGYETFTGGYITGGKGTRVNNWSRGGAFYISGAVEMYGGTVIGNGQYGTTHGGGFSTIESGTFKMYGGSIQNNAGQCGGATRLQGAVCEILGGKIINNVVSADGGGIHVGGTIPVILKDCEISGNYAENGPGAGIWMTTTGTEVSGSTVIENNLTSKGVSNIELGNGYTIAVGTLNNDAKIGIKMNNGTGVFTSGWSSKMQGKDPTEYFTSDNKSFDVLLGSNNEAEIGDSPAASIINGETTTKYPSFSDALSNWSEGSTLKLLKDVSTSSTITVPTGEHTLDLNGYGILMTGNGRVLTINKNVSLELNDSNPERIHYITLSDYRGTAVSNSGETSVSNGNGVIKVTGGYLTGGFLNNSGSHDKCGAGVFNWGTFVMNGGNIVGNIMQNNSGGGIRNSGFFTMNDGTIAFNKASANGGGVTTYVPGGGQGKMTMNGGVISDNYCGSYGGGIQLAGPFELTGGSVTRNTAGAGGSGVFYGGQGDKFKLSGNPIIKDNVNDDLYLNADATFMISDSLTEGAEIGILMNKNAVFTVGWKDNMGDANPADYFTSDNTSYVVRLKSGEVAITPPHEHIWNYTADGSTITANCTGEGTCYLSAQTLTISASSKTYDETAVSAQLIFSDDWSNDNDLITPSDSDIVYSGNTDAGTYTASITVDGKTASTEFTISEKSMADEISPVEYSGDYDGNSHSACVNAPSGATVKYGTEIGSYTLDKCPTYTNAGKYTVYYRVTKKNYITVTGTVSVTINKINATVTIAGNNTAIDFDGIEHSVTGYTASTQSTLYDVENDFDFSATAVAKRTNAGTTAMGLTANQFENNNPNFETVTFNVTDGYITVNPIPATVTITGHNLTVDYNGNAHSADGYDAVADTDLYDVTADFTYGGRPQAVRTDAGTTQMNLDYSKFENVNSNFSTVTFIIASDGYITVEPIPATITITGNNDTADYDGKEHTVTGYEAVADTDLYDVTKDFTFSGNATASQTIVGTAYMELAPEQFENTNPNFEDVTFVVTDGYQAVTRISSTLTKKPKAKQPLVYTKSEQELIVKGEAYGGELYYAIGKDSKTAPDEKEFKKAIPSAKDIGNYYIWYCIKGDFNHYDIEPACLKVTLADKDWVTVNGVVNQEGNAVPVKDAEVILMNGKKEVERITTNENGEYYFTVPAGVYDVVIKHSDVTETKMLELYSDKEQNLEVSDGNTESRVDVDTDDGDFGIAIGGLDAEAKAIRKADNLSSGQKLSVVMTVEPKTKKKAKNSKAFDKLSVNSSFVFFDAKLEKTVDSKTTALKSSQTVLEIAVPYNKINRKNITAYYSDGSEAKKLKKSDSKEAGTYRIDKKNKIVYIYSKDFATFAIGYTPHYKVKSSVSLGKYKGKVSVVLKGKNGEGTFSLKDVSLDKANFDSVPKGQYKMTVSWKDGVKNKLTVDITVS